MARGWRTLRKVRLDHGRSARSLRRAADCRRRHPMVKLIRSGGTRLYIEEPPLVSGNGPGVAFFASADLGADVALEALADAHGVFCVFCAFAQPAAQAWTLLAAGLQSELKNLSSDEFS